MNIVKLLPKEWKELSESAHLICFNERSEAGSDRIDFALLALKDESPCAYVTCREVDSETLYWQYGGAMPNIKDTVNSYKAYESLTGFCREMGYIRITTLVKNTNIVMLKFAMKIGYRIIGIRYSDGEIYLEHCLELKENKI